TKEKLQSFLAFLEKWNRSINLIGKSQDAWARHIEDSAQLLHASYHMEGLWLDLGSGGGLPGLVVAIILQESSPNATCTLLESDERKAIFLETAARSLAVPITVLNTRIETAPPQNARTISARALAPLPKLLPLASRHAATTSTLLFPKGAAHLAEIEESRCLGYPAPDILPSRVDPKSVVLKYEIKGGRFA
ncbi:MAG: 16S rRNA (guanine(527)-N(7))-methyltransferase RsmG, partial [Pseudomonadota bacterium]